LNILAEALTGRDLHQLDSNRRFRPLILVPPLPRFPGAISHFVTSMTAPIASRWSKVGGWDLHPLENAALAPRTPHVDFAGNVLKWFYNRTSYSLRIRSCESFNASSPVVEIEHAAEPFAALNWPIGRIARGTGRSLFNYRWMAT
jgi:hypothetical protein